MWESGFQVTTANREPFWKDCHCDAVQDFVKAAMEPVLALAQEFLINEVHQHRKWRLGTMFVVK